MVTLREKASGQWELLMLIIFCARVFVFTGNIRHKRSQIFNVGGHFCWSMDGCSGRRVGVTCMWHIYCLEKDMYSAR